MALVLGTFVTGMVSNPMMVGVSSEIIFGLAFLCVLTAGGIQVLWGAMGLSNLVKYIPRPVVSGFINGIALLLVFGQFRLILGIEGDTSYFEIMRHPEIVNPITATAGVITIVSIYGANRFFKQVPPHLAGLIIGIGSYHFFLIFFPESQPGLVIGSLERHFPLPDVFIALYDEIDALPMASILPQLIGTSFALSLIGSMESLLSAVVVDNLSGNHHNSKKEIIGQGIGNMIGSAFGSIFSNGSVVRSIVNYKAGGRTNLSAIFSSLFILLIILCFGQHTGKIPIAVIAGIIFVIGFNMFDIWTLNVLKKCFVLFQCEKEVRADLLINLFVAAITISINLIAAVGVGVLVASAVFIFKMGRSVIKQHYFANDFHSYKMRQIEDVRLLEKKGKQISVLQLQGPIFFGSAEHLAKEIQKILPQATCIIIDFRLVGEIDSTGVAILLRLEQTASKEKKKLLFANLNNNKSLWTFMETMGFGEKLSDAFLFQDTDAALEWAEDFLLSRENFQKDMVTGFELAKVSLFRDFMPDELQAIQGILKFRIYEKGTAVFMENDHCRDLYILISGLMTVSFYLKEKDQYNRLITYTHGTVFGEMSFLDGRPRSACVWANEQSQVYCLPFTEFEDLRKTMPELANKLFRNIALEISGYLRRASNQIRRLEDNL